MLEKEDSFRVIAHRGASFVAPENTMTAFRMAIEMGAKEVETDVQLTTDNRLVLCHDDNLQRYGHGERRVEALTFRELSEMDFGSWFSPSFQAERIVCLEDLLDLGGTTLTYHIELKGKHPDLPLHLLQCLETQGMLSNSVITSFSLPMLQEFHRLAPDARLGWLVKSMGQDTLNIAEQLQLFQLCPQAVAVTEEDVARALQIVREVRAWGCPRNERDAQQTAMSMKNAGCCGVTVDNPQWLLGIL